MVETGSVSGIDSRDCIGVTRRRRGACIGIRGARVVEPIKPPFSIHVIAGHAYIVCTCGPSEGQPVVAVTVDAAGLEGGDGGVVSAATLKVVM